MSQNIPPKNYIKPKTCSICGTVYQPKSWTPKMVPYCSEPCKLVAREARKLKREAPCLQCGKVVHSTDKYSLEMLRHGRAYCSEECKRAYLSANASATMAATNRKYASERMTNRNPAQRPDVRAKISAARRGKAPTVRAGNGELTMPQTLLAQALGLPMEFAVPTASVASQFTERLPSAYKIDIADPVRMLAIEVDGSTHRSYAIRAKDELKTRVLNALGWKVLRFWNREVMGDLEACVQTVLSTT